MGELDAFMMSGDLKPGDKAPGGGTVGDFGDSAEMFIRAVLGRQERGAIITGRRVKKIKSEEGDRTPDGREGTVLGSISQPNQEPLHVKGMIAVYCYFIQWDGDTVPIFTTDIKVEEL